MYAPLPDFLRILRLLSVIGAQGDTFDNRRIEKSLTFLAENTLSPLRDRENNQILITVFVIQEYEWNFEGRMCLLQAALKNNYYFVINF